VTPEPPGVPERGQRTRSLLGRLSGQVQPWQLGLAGGIVVAIVVGGYLWLSDGSSPTETADAPPPVAEQGVACSHLQEAFAHNQARDRQALRRSVDAAARASEQALQQSGQEFGRPEEIAIELQYALTQQTDRSEDGADEYLTQAREVCARLGLWSD
jgi:hypothetical protein